MRHADVSLELMMHKPRVLLFSNWFYPGYRGGGSQTAAVNLVRALGSEFEFHVVTRDRDTGERSQFPGISTGGWMERDNSRIRYLSPTELRFGEIDGIIRQIPHDLIHLNSVMSLPFAAYPLLVRQFRAVSVAPLLISPHGELAPEALAQKRFRKSLYLSTAEALGAFRNANWHAATLQEEHDIKCVRGPRANVGIAPVLPPQYSFTGKAPARPPKKEGALRGIFFARIDRMKNLDLAIDMVAPIPNVTLDICGPVGQQDYWEECQAKIRASGRPDAFRYLGGIPAKDVNMTLSQYDVLFLPSKSESFGYAILDALAASCPVLISDRTPWRGLEAARIGFDVSLNQPDIFRARLTDLCDLDEVAHSAMRVRARKYACNYVENSSAKEAWRAVYTNTITRTA